MSDYRDDHDALTERVQTLQTELDGTRADLERERAKGTPDERAEKLEAELQAAREQLARMEIALTELRQGSSPGVRSLAYKHRMALVAVACLGVGALTVIALRGSPAPPPPPPPPPPLPTPAKVDPVPPAPAPTPTPVATVPPSKPATPEASKVNVSWTGRVTMATGKNVPVGSTCKMESTITSGSDASLRLSAFVVRCGDTKIYDGTTMTAGMREHGEDTAQQLGKKEGTVVFDLAEYKDTGTGSTPQVTFDGAKGRGYVWHDYPDAFRIELTFSRVSAPVEMAPMGELGKAALSMRARVRGVSGRVRPTVGTECIMHASPSSRDRCYVSVDCGAAGVLYGAAPFESVVKCNAVAAAAGSAPLELTDSTPSKDDDDPRLHYAASDGAITVADEPKSGASWSVDLMPIDGPGAASTSDGGK